MRPVTVDPNNVQAALQEIERASHENDIVEIAQNFSFDNPAFSEIYELLTDSQPDSYTTMLLHFDGPNLSQNGLTFVDASRLAAQPSLFGNVALSTTQAKFGYTSASFDGTNSYLTLPDNAALRFQGDFTVDCWAYTTADGVRELWTKYNVGNVAPVHVRGNADGTWRLAASSNGVTNDIINIVSFGTLTLNTWQHIEVGRSSGTFYAFVDGVLGLTSFSALTPFSGTDVFAIGARNSTPDRYFSGFIDEFRFSTGIARHTAAFTPPTTPYGSPTLANTNAVLATLIQIMQKGGLNRTT